MVAPVTLGLIETALVQAGANGVSTERFKDAPTGNESYDRARAHHKQRAYLNGVVSLFAMISAGAGSSKSVRKTAIVLAAGTAARAVFSVCRYVTTIQKPPKTILWLEFKESYTSTFGPFAVLDYISHPGNRPGDK